MANSANVNAGDDTLASQYNNLRKDVLDLSTGHIHDGVGGKIFDFLHILDTNSASSGIALLLKLDNVIDTPATNDGQSIEFFNGWASGSVPRAGIEMRYMENSASKTSLVFRTRDGGTYHDSMVIDKNGNTEIVGRPKDKTGYVMPVGSITLFGGASAVDGWLICDGSAISRTTYADLFSAIGTTFGVGDGSTTFNIPDLRDNFAIGKSGTKALGSTGGEDTHTLSVAEMPSHNHGGNTGNTDAWIEGILTNVALGTDLKLNLASHLHTISAQGGGSAHENKPPYLALNYIIKT